MLTLVLVRHGESIRNYFTDLAREGHSEPLETHLQTHQDEREWPLTDLGFEQARVAGGFIRSEFADTFDHGFVSPFLRARETAEGLGIRLEWTVDERLRERLWGTYEAGTYTAEQYIEDLKRCSELHWKSPFPDAESVADLEPEARDFLSSLPHEGAILVVTHGGTLGAIEKVLEGNPPHRALGNCGIIHYELECRGAAWLGQARWACPAFGDLHFGPWQTFGESPSKDC